MLYMYYGRPHLPSSVETKINRRQVYPGNLRPTEQTKLGLCINGESRIAGINLQWDWFEGGTRSRSVAPKDMTRDIKGYWTTCDDRDLRIVDWRDWNKAASSGRKGCSGDAVTGGTFRAGRNQGPEEDSAAVEQDRIIALSLYYTCVFARLPSWLGWVGCGDERRRLTSTSWQVLICFTGM